MRSVLKDSISLMRLFSLTTKFLWVINTSCYIVLINDFMIHDLLWRLTKIELTVHMKRDETFTKLVKTPKIEWCGYIANSGKHPNRFVKFLFDILRTTIPKMFEKCPRMYDVSLVNMKVPEKYVTFLPQTGYMFNLNLNYPEKKASFIIILEFEIQ